MMPPGLGIVLGTLLIAANTSSSAAPALRPQTTIEYRSTIVPESPRPGETFSLFLTLIEREADGTTRRLVHAAPDIYFMRLGNSRSLIRDARRALALEEEGTFAATFTPTTLGTYILDVRGESTAGRLRHRIVLPIGTKSLATAALPSLPKKRPKPSLGNVFHGKQLCAMHCSASHAAFRRARIAQEAFLESSFANAQDDAALIATLTDGATRTWTPLERRDLLTYLRSLHFSVRDFFPSATHVTATSVAPDDLSVDSLREAAIDADLPLHPQRVFAVYAAADVVVDLPIWVKDGDIAKIADIQPTNKLGYIVFFVKRHSRGVEEVAIAVGNAPRHPVLAVRSKGAGATINTRINTQLAKLQFSEGSQRSGSNQQPIGAHTWLAPLYLRTAELVSAYEQNNINTGSSSK